MATHSYYSSVPTAPQPDYAYNPTTMQSHNQMYDQTQSSDAMSNNPVKPQFDAEAYGDPGPFKETHEMEQTDKNLKRRIRLLRTVSRALSLILALAAFIPLALTLSKFHTTRHTVRTVIMANGTAVRRTAWAANSRVWPTYLYFTLALVSLVFSICTLVAYFRNVKTANVAATVTTAFTWLVLGVDVVIWSVVVAIYRYEKGVVTNGKHTDLWGWSCSPAARSIQKVFSKEVQFDRYCNIQEAGWIAGLLHAGAMILSAVIWLFVWRRRSTRREIRRSTTMRSGPPAMAQR